jgi:hypothetical protein
LLSFLLLLFADFWNVEGWNGGGVSKVLVYDLGFFHLEQKHPVGKQMPSGGRQI